MVPVLALRQYQRFHEATNRSKSVKEQPKGPLYPIYWENVALLKAKDRAQNQPKKAD